MNRRAFIRSCLGGACGGAAAIIAPRPVSPDLGTVVREGDHLHFTGCRFNGPTQVPVSGSVEMYNCTFHVDTNGEHAHAVQFTDGRNRT